MVDLEGDIGERRGEKVEKSEKRVKKNPEAIQTSRDQLVTTGCAACFHSALN